MLEVMASPRFHLKELGYLAASQCFNEDTDVLILATNLLKKVGTSLKLANVSFICADS